MSKPTPADLRSAFRERELPLLADSYRSAAPFMEGLMDCDLLVKQLVRSREKLFSVRTKPNNMLHASKAGRCLMSLLPWITSAKIGGSSVVSFHPYVELLLMSANEHGVSNWYKSQFEQDLIHRPSLIASTLNGMVSAIREASDKPSFRHAVRRHDDLASLRYRTLRADFMALLKQHPLILVSRFELQALPPDTQSGYFCDQPIRYLVDLFEKWMQSIRTSYGNAFVGAGWKVDLDICTNQPYIHVALIHSGITESELQFFRIAITRDWEQSYSHAIAFDRNSSLDTQYMRCTDWLHGDQLNQQQNLENIAAYLCLTDRLFAIRSQTGCKTTGHWKIAHQKQSKSRKACTHERLALTPGLPQQLASDNSPSSSSTPQVEAPWSAGPRLS